ncbi:MAG: hypothetical protein M1838_003544 [Thelocarpon superellum]|nr:MAG: hypothetical protein M1838_003544 [Thelocarpon superellum]
MKVNGILSLAALCSIVTAAPLEKRDISTHTVSFLEIETAVVTTTIFINPTGGASLAPVVPAATPAPPPAAASPPQAPAPAPVPAPAPSPSPKPAPPPPAPPAPSHPAPEPQVAAVKAAAPPPAPVASSAPAPPTTPKVPALQSLSGTAISQSGSCSSSSPCTGDLTTYDVGLGACGQTSTPDQAVVALSYELMGTQSNGNPFCGKSITIEYGGVTKTATVVDKCMGCEYGSVDLSTSLYNAFGFDGRAHGAHWYFN